MANDESVLREVDQELAQERQWEYFRKNGPLVIGAAILVVAAVGGWQFFNFSKAETAKQSALEYNSAIEVLEEDPTGGLAALDGVFEETSGGYPVLAQLRRAAILASEDDRLGALAAYRSVAADGRTPKHLRDLARLRASYLLLEDGRDAVTAELGPMVEAQTQFGYYAREIAALSALESKDYDTALRMFRSASIDLFAPTPVRQRAEELAALSASGKSGVNIFGEWRTEDLFKAIGEDIDEGAADDETVIDEPGSDDSLDESGPDEDEAEESSVEQNGDASKSDASENG